MMVLGIAMVGLAGVVLLVVGVQMLRISWRNPTRPEFAMGLGILCLTVVGGPITGLSRAPGWVGTEAGSQLFAIAMLPTSLGVALLYVFPWRVFRGNSFWALLIVLVAAIAAGANWHGIVSASEGDTMAAIFARTRPWGIRIVAALAGAFTWTAIEALAYGRRLQRQLAVGLADPVVLDRIRLWALGAFGVVMLCVALIVAMSFGRPPFRDPVALVSMGAGAMLFSACFWLAFFPPEAYLRRLRPTPKTA